MVHAARTRRPAHRLVKLPAALMLALLPWSLAVSQVRSTRPMDPNPPPRCAKGEQWSPEHRRCLRMPKLPGDTPYNLPQPQGTVSGNSNLLGTPGPPCDEPFRNCVPPARRLERIPGAPAAVPGALPAQPRAERRLPGVATDRVVPGQPARRIDRGLRTPQQASGPVPHAR